MPRGRKRRLPLPEQIADANPMTDYIERRNGKLYLISREGYLRPVEVLDREFGEGLEEFRKNVTKLTRAEEINRWRRLVAMYPWLTKPAKEVRVTILREKWRELFGDAMFVVED